MTTSTRFVFLFFSFQFFLPTVFCSESTGPSTPVKNKKLAPGIFLKTPNGLGKLDLLPFVIETKRLLIAPVLTEEMRQVVPNLLLSNGLNSLSTMFRIDDPDAFSLEDFLLWLRDSYLYYQGEKQHRFLAFEKDDQSLIPVGMLALDKISDRGEKGLNTCLYISDPGKGIGLKLSTAIITWIRDQTDYRFIETNVLSDNPAAVAICKKFGFLKVRSALEKYLESFSGPDYLDLTSKEQHNLLRTILKLRTVNCDYYRLNL